MKKFEDLYVPPADHSLINQESFCKLADCIHATAVDCGECLFCTSKEEQFYRWASDSKNIREFLAELYEEQP